MKISMLLFAAFLYKVPASVGETCLPGKIPLLIQTGLSFNLVWLTNDTDQDNGVHIPFLSPVTEATVCRRPKQLVYIQETDTKRWYKLIYHNGILIEMEAGKYEFSRERD